MDSQQIPSNIPGHELLNKGLQDLIKNNLTEEAYLVLIGQQNLRNSGIKIPDYLTNDLPEHLLYRLLAARLGDEAHSAYNALIRKLCSAERILNSP